MAQKNGTTETTTTTPAPKQASKEDMRKLFAAYDKADAEVDSLQAKLEDAKLRRGTTVEAIVNGAGGRKGPFKHPSTGMVLSAVERKDKTGEGPSSWYFKGPSQSDVIEV